MGVLTIIDEKIRENEKFSLGLEIEKRELEKQRKEAEKKIGIDVWVGNIFESSSGLTDEFSSFSRDFKKYLKGVAGTDFELYFSRGHFECYGFLKNKKTDKFAYFSISDVRYFKDSWWDNVLVRTAKNEKDYTGGSNNSCRLTDLRENIKKLTA